MHLRVFERLVKSVNQRQIVLPLSGGYDSRLIAVMLARLGYDNVVCFSYGKPGNWESEISRRVAEKLGYKWLFVPYSRRKWRTSFQSEERLAYTRRASALCSPAVLQDWLAVRELTDHKLLSQDAIFVPGHTNDFITGGHIPAELAHSGTVPTLQALLLSIARKHYSIWRVPPDDAVELFGPKLLQVLDGCHSIPSTIWLVHLSFGSGRTASQIHCQQRASL